MQLNIIKEKIIKSNRSKTWLITLYIIEPVSLVLSLLFDAMKIIHPSFITFVGMFFYGLSCYSFITGNYAFGSLYFYIAWVFDFTDGKLARIQDLSSDLGAKLDHIINLYGKLLVVLGMIYVFYYLEGHLILGLILFLIHYGNHYLVKKILKIRPTSAKVFPGMHEIEEGQRPHFFSPKRILNLFSPYEENFLVFIIGPLTGTVTQMIILSAVLYLLNSFVLSIIKKRKSA